MSKTIIVTGGAGFIGSNFVFHMLNTYRLPHCMFGLPDVCRQFINISTGYG